MIKILTLLRHAKTEAGSATQNDRDRALVARGIEAARAMGTYLVSERIRPNLVLCSAAQRARQTAQLAFPDKTDITYSEQMYLPSAGEMINILKDAPENAPHVMLIGHNPGMHELAVKLAKTGDEKLLDTLTLHFPTCTLASIALEGTWQEIGRVPGKLTRLVTAKSL